MLIVNQIENTHFSKTEKEIVDYIIDQGMNIEKMSANEIVYKRSFACKNC